MARTLRGTKEIKRLLVLLVIAAAAAVASCDRVVDLTPAPDARGPDASASGNDAGGDGGLGGNDGGGDDGGIATPDGGAAPDAWPATQRATGQQALEQADAAVHHRSPRHDVRAAFLRAES